jgi:hypothetical protein
MENVLAKCDIVKNDSKIDYDAMENDVKKFYATLKNESLNSLSDDHDDESLESLESLNSLGDEHDDEISAYHNEKYSIVDSGLSGQIYSLFVLRFYFVMLCITK